MILLQLKVDPFSLTEIVPPDVQEEVKANYSALLELLRHFWTCFPVSSKSLEEKVMEGESIYY